jgi:hypothetical protein
MRYVWAREWCARGKDETAAAARAQPVRGACCRQPRNNVAAAAGSGEGWQQGLNSGLDLDGAARSALDLS